MGTECHDAALDEASFAKATQRGRRILSSGPVAKLARYETGRIHVELNNGCAFALSVEPTQGLAGAKVSELRKIEVTAAGLGLYWPTLDVDLFVPTLVKAVLGTKLWMGRTSARSAARQEVTSKPPPRASTANSAEDRASQARSSRPEPAPTVTAFATRP